MKRLLKIFRRTLPYLSAVGFIFVFLYAESVPSMDVLNKEIYLLVPVVAIFFLVLVSVVGMRKFTLFIRSMKHVRMLLVLTLSTYGLFLFINLLYIRWVLLGLVALLLLVYVQRLDERYFRAKYREDSLNLFHVYSIISVFLFLAVAFGVTRLMQVPAWMVAIAVAIVLGWIVWELLRAFEVSKKELRISTLSLSIIFGQWYLALAALPTEYMVSASVFTIFFDFILKVFISALSKEESKLNLRRQVSFSSILIVIILLTSRWL